MNWTNSWQPQTPGISWELYAIDKDRTELNELGKENPEKVRELGELWRKEAERTLIYPKPVRKKAK